MLSVTTIDRMASVQFKFFQNTIVVSEIKKDNYAYKYRRRGHSIL